MVCLISRPHAQSITKCDIVRPDRFRREEHELQHYQNATAFSNNFLAALSQSLFFHKFLFKNFPPITYSCNKFWRWTHLSHVRSISIPFRLRIFVIEADAPGQAALLFASIVFARARVSRCPIVRGFSYQNQHFVYFEAFHFICGRNQSSTTTLWSSIITRSSVQIPAKRRLIEEVKNIDHNILQ